MYYPKGNQEVWWKMKDIMHEGDPQFVYQEWLFGEVDYDKLSQETKDKDLTPLIFMIMKRKGEIMSRY